MTRPPRRRAALLLSLLALLLLAGCIDLPTFLPEPDVTLRIAVPDQNQAAYLADRIGAFQRENPSIRVKVFSQMSVYRSNLASGISTLASSSDGLDVVYLTDQDFQALSDPSVLSELTPYIRETTDLQPPEFYPTALPVFQSRGRQMALPAEMVPMVIFYNRDLFDQAKAEYPTPDWTTTDFLTAAKRLAVKQPGRAEMIPFVADPTSTVWPFVLAYGGEFPNPTRDASARVLTTPETVRGFQWFADLGIREKVMPMPPNPRALGLWFTGRAGMVALFMSARNFVPPQGPPQSGATPTPGPRQSWPFHWDVAPIPREARRATIVYVAGYAIPKGAKNPNEAWQLIRYLIRTLPAQGAGSSYVPALKSLALSSEFASLYAEPGKRAYLESVEYGYTIPVLPPAARPGEQDLAPIFRGDVSAEQGLQRLREKVAPALGKWAQENQ